MGFDVVGVQFDQAGNDEIAAHVFGLRRRRAAAEVGNHAVLGDDPAALDHLVGEHQAGIGEGEGARRSGHGFQKSPCRSCISQWTNLLMPSITAS